MAGAENTTLKLTLNEAVLMRKLAQQGQKELHDRLVDDRTRGSAGWQMADEDKEMMSAFDGLLRKL